MQFDYTNYPGMGLRPLTIKSSAVNRTGATLAIGEIVMTDTLALDPDDGQVAGDLDGGGVNSSVTSNPGDIHFPLNNVITPTTAGIGAITQDDPGYWFAVVTDLGTVGTGADNTIVGVTWQGRVLAKMAATVATAQYGKPLVAANGVRTLTLTVADQQKVIARLEADITTANALSPVLFSGIDGFGLIPAAS